MIYSVRLYNVPLAAVPVFVGAFRLRGLWTDIARLQSGYIHTDLLRNPSDPTKFMSIEFWSSIKTLMAARRSPEVRSFARWLDCQAIDCEGLGMFIFPPRPSEPELQADDLTCPVIGESTSLESQEFEANVLS